MHRVRRQPIVIVSFIIIIFFIIIIIIIIIISSSSIISILLFRHVWLWVNHSHAFYETYYSCRIWLKINREQISHWLA